MVPPSRLPSLIGPWLILTLVVAALYGRTTTYSFVWDDVQLIAQSKTLPQAGVADLLSDFWTTSEHGIESGYFRPLTTLTFLLDSRIHGQNAGGYHLTNVILYGLTCGLVFLLFQRVLGDRAAAVAGALIFTLHPAHVEPVAFISSRTDLLAALLVLAAYLVGTSQASAPSWLRSTGAAALFFLAILAKESALPLLLFAPFFARREHRKSLSLGLAAAAAAAIALRFAVLPSAIPATIVQRAPLPSRLLTAPAVIVYYLGVIFFPFSLSALPAMDWVSSPADFRFLVPLLALAGVGGGLLAIRPRAPATWLGSAWGFLFLLPVVQVVQTAMRAAERFAFLPSVGFVLAVAGVLQGLWRSRNGVAKTGSGALLFAVLGAFAIATNARVPVWKDAAALWEATARSEPGNPTVMNNLAGVRFEEGRYTEAEALYRRAAMLAPENPVALYNLGLVLARQGRQGEAVTWLDRALARDPALAPARDLRQRVLHSLRPAGPVP